MDRLKKQLDEQMAIKNKLTGLTKKQTPNFATTDLETLVYEKKVSEKLFVNSYGSGDYLTSILVVVNGKSKGKFQECYQTCLSDYNKTDFANWKKRTFGAIEAAN